MTSSLVHSHQNRNLRVLLSMLMRLAASGCTIQLDVSDNMSHLFDIVSVSNDVYGRQRNLFPVDIREVPVSD